MSLDYSHITHISYIILAISTAIYVGQGFYRNGEPLLYDVFKHHPHWVKPINNVLLTGFYLLNIGAIVMYVSDGTGVHTANAFIEFLAIKLGTVYVVLAMIHFGNIATLFYVKNNVNL